MIANLLRKGKAPAYKFFNLSRVCKKLFGFYALAFLADLGEKPILPTILGDLGKIKLLDFSLFP